MRRCFAVFGKDNDQKDSDFDRTVSNEDVGFSPVPTEEIVTSPVQLDRRFITPSAPRINYLQSSAVEQITSDLVLSNLDTRLALIAQTDGNVLAYIDNLELVLGEPLIRLRNVFATELHYVTNISRGMHGFTAQLYKTQRVEHLSGEAGYYFIRRPRQTASKQNPLKWFARLMR